MANVGDFVDKKDLFDGKYKLLRKLSSAGGTADVWLAEDHQTVDKVLSDDDEVVEVEGSGVLVAVKIYRPKNLLDVEGEQTFKKEFKTVYNCRHTNLLKPTAFSICGDVPYLVMPFCEEGSAEKLSGQLTQKDEIWKFIFDTASGLSYLHSCTPPIIHQDIKPANILKDEKGNYCITDFGISVKTGCLAEYYWDNEGGGTIIYMPPERFGNDYKAMPESDIWALGATVYELVTGDLPYGDKGGEAQRMGEPIPEIAVKLPKNLKAVIYSCLDVDPKKRPSASDLAEIARTKGRKRTIFYVPVLFVIVLLLAIIIAMNAVTPEKMDSFTAYSNSGDSIVNIEKSNAEAAAPIEHAVSSRRLKEALLFYDQAIREKTDNTGRLDSVNARVSAIRRLVSLFDVYQTICSDLERAKNEGAEIQESLQRAKRDSMSNIIKENIINL